MKPTMEIADTKQIEKNNQNVVENSFASSFYTDGFTELKRIYDENRDNPSKIQMDSDAYIEGISQDVPEEYRDATIRPFNTIKDSYVKQATVDFASKQTEAAEQTTDINTVKAKMLVEKSISDNDPEDVQAVLSADYFDKVDDAVRRRKITPQQGIHLRKTYASNLMANQLSDILNDSSFNTQQKMNAVANFIDGKTGSAAVDGMGYLDRINVANSVMNNNTQMRAFRKSFDAEVERNLEKQFDNAFVQLAPIVYNYNGYDGPDGTLNDRNEAIKKLINMAQTPEQLEKAYALKNSTFKNNQYAVDNLDVDLALGQLTEDNLEKEFTERNIDVKKRQEYLDKMNTPLFQNQQTFGYKNAIEMIKASYPINKSIGGSVSVTNGILSVSSDDPNAKLQFDAINRLNIFSAEQMRTPQEYNEFVKDLFDNSNAVSEYRLDGQRKNISKRIMELSGDKDAKYITEQLKNKMEPVKDINGKEIKRSEKEAEQMVLNDIGADLVTKGYTKKEAFEQAKQIMKLYGSVKWQ